MARVPEELVQPVWSGPRGTGSAGMATAQKNWYSRYGHGPEELVQPVWPGPYTNTKLASLY